MGVGPYAQKIHAGVCDSNIFEVNARWRERRWRRCGFREEQYYVERG
jgi:hypothetical protein